MKGSIKEKVLLVLGTAFLVVLVGLLLFDLTRRGIFDGGTGINIAIVGDKGVSVLLLRPEDQMAGWVSLPQDVRVKVFNSSANYPIESLWNYSVSENNPYEITEKTIGQAMGVIISRTIKINGNSSIEDVLGKLFTMSLKTDLSIRDRFTVRQFLSDSVKSKKILELAIPNAVFDKVTDPDGKKFLEFNQAMSLWTKNKFVVEAVLNENADISINNMTGTSGLGNILANQLESAGAHVVEVKANTDEKIIGKGCLYYTKKRYETTEAVLRDQVGCNKLSVKPSFVEDDDTLKVWLK